MRNTQISEQKRSYAFEGFVLHEDSNDLFFQGNICELPPKVAQCLAYLVANHGRLVSKAELIDALWADTFVEENALSYTISRLRKALSALAPEIEFIKTVPRRGFRFVPEVTALKPGVILPFEDRGGPEAPAATETAETKFERPKLVHTAVPAAREFLAPLRTRRSFVLAAVLLATILVTSGAFFAWRSSKPAPPVVLNSIAVLPLGSFSNTDDANELRLRIADAIITRLGNLSHIVVRPTTAIANYSDGDRDALEIGRKLKVDAVLDGRLQDENGKLRATVQLISVHSGEQIWSATFDGSSDRLLSLQDQIAENMLAKLIELSPQERDSKLTVVATANSEAYENYLRGRYFFEQRAFDYDAALARSKEYFEKALAADPNFTSATAELANVINLQTGSGVYKRVDGYTKARELALRALQGNKDLPEAHIALGWVHQKLDYNFVEAERSFKRALELNPNNLLANLWISINYSLRGKFAESERHIANALELDPASSSAHNEMMYLLVRSGRCDEAMEKMPDTLAFVQDPARRRLIQGEWEAMCRRFDTAIPLLEQGAAELEARGMAPSRVYVVLGYAYAAAGDTARARNVAERLESIKSRRNVLSGLVATYAHLGDKAAFSRSLEELYRSGDERLLQLKVDPRFAIVRDDPAFIEVLRKVNLL